jgi:hypothetical protein
MKKSLIFQIIYSVVVLGLFYYIGFSFYSLAIIAILFALIILLKGKLYRKIKDFADKKLPSLSKLPAWVKKLIVILFFILIYILIKEIVFFILKLVGVDVQEIMMNNINQSLAN